MFLQVMKKLTDTLMNEMLPRALKKKHTFYLEKSNHFPILALSFHELCDAMTFSTDLIFEHCSPVKNVLTDTMMTENDTVVLDGIKFVYRDDSYKFAFFDNFREWGFCCKESNPLLVSQVAFTCWKTWIEAFIEDAETSFDKIYVWIARKKAML